MRLERLNRQLAREVEVLQLRSKIQSDVQDQVTQSQREYYLREQMKAIQKELGEADEQQEIEELRKKIEAAGMTEEAKKEAMRELNRLAKMSPAAADYHVTRTYLDWLVVLPWNKFSGLQGRPAESQRRSWTRTTTTWKRSKNASSTTWPCCN